MQVCLGVLGPETMHAILGDADGEGSYARMTMAGPCQLCTRRLSLFHTDSGTERSSISALLDGSQGLPDYADT